MPVCKLLHPIFHDSLLLLLERIVLVDILESVLDSLVVEVVMIGGGVLYATGSHVELGSSEILLNLLSFLVHCEILGLECRPGGRVNCILVLVRFGSNVSNIKVAFPRILLPGRHVRSVVSNCLFIYVAC